MARSRYIKPDFFDDTRMAEVSVPARLLYVGLWTIMDRQGVAEDDAKLIKKHVYPYDDSITIKKVQGMIDELESIGRLHRISHGGKRYLFCPTFTRHQWFHGGERSKYPIPKDTLLKACSDTDQEQFNDGANPSVDGNGNGELIGSTPSGEGTPTDAPPSVLPEFKEIGGLLVGRRVSLDVQRNWLELYRDPSWVIAKIKRAVSWEAETGRRKQRFSAFMGRWLAKDWDNRRAPPATGINTTPLNLNLEPAT